MIYKKLDVKQPLGYFFSTMTNIMELNTSLVGIDKISIENTDTIYDIEYFNSFGTLHLIFNNVDACFMSFNDNKYLIFARTERNKDMIEKYEERWNFIKEEIRLIDGVKPFNYKRHFMKIKFKCYYRVPINEILNISVCVLIIKSIFKTNDKYYPQIYLDSCYFKESIINGS